MFNKLHSGLASRLASTMLAAVLFAALTAPFIMLQSMHVFAATPALPCTQANYNGCTELSATPPEDLQSVPPNLVLMMDDSGSMAWNYMPDWNYVGNPSGLPANYNPSWAQLRDSSINSVYYNPATLYSPPPKADGTFYAAPTGITKAFMNPFLGSTPTQNVTTYGSNSTTADTFAYWESLGAGSTSTNLGSPVTVTTPGACAAGFHQAGTLCVSNYTAPFAPTPGTTTTTYTCNAGDTLSGQQCSHNNGEGPPTTYPATATTKTTSPSCPAGSSLNGTTGMCQAKASTNFPNPTTTTTCATGSGGPGGTLTGGSCIQTTTASVKVFAYYVGGVEYYVASGTTCSQIANAAQQANCVNEGDTQNSSGVQAAPTGVTAGQNVANWFSYYRTRLLMAKSGLMTAFSTVDPKYRFGFASINATNTSPIPATTIPPSTVAPTPYSFNDQMVTDGIVSGGSSSNQLAVVQPFGDGSPGTQKANFWTWLASVNATGTFAYPPQTPLRMALDAVGQYYKTSQPWTTMPGDPGWAPGSTTQFTCRASYTILTTDGFWNGTAPTDVGNVAANDGPIISVPSGNVTQYTAVDPYKGGAVNGGSEPSLADIATYYWENDLNTTLANEVSPSKSDPASWQHMTTFTIGLGFTPLGITPAGTTVSQILGWSTGGAAITGFAWPTPASNSLYNIADLAHAAVNGHGDFFNVTNPTELANAFSTALATIGARNVAPTAAGVNASVLSVGAAAFLSGYSTADWTSEFQDVTLKSDGSIDTILWKADALLDSLYHSSTGYSNRNVYTNAYNSGAYSSFKFTAAASASLDPVEIAGLETPALTGDDDTLANRIDFLLGDNTYEGVTYRSRSSILGAILHAEPVYVAGPSDNYADTWPTFGSITPPEAATGAQTYSAFSSAVDARAGMVYVGANDGMLHAFNAPVPTCTGPIDSNGNCTAYTFADGANQGQEAWAFIPRAAYANLGNLTNPANFKFLPTVDATPVTRDVFFSGDDKWHTLLAGGVGLGGRGVYGLDITSPSTFSASDALWEFDSDMTVDSGCVTNDGTACRGTDLGYTVAQPNIGRLANGHWVVLVPNGYFPDCTTPDLPTADAASCQAIAAQAPKDASGNPYSALFVLDAETGKVLAELKTPTNLGVTSFGLAEPVLGDYNNDQVDDVAFAGDVQGNLWRFDLSSTDPSKWAVTLVYSGLTDANGNQGVQPITTMPRLFPDPTTNRFMVLFGTGKYLGVGDNSNSSVQAVIAVRDVVGTTYSQSNLVQQFLHETVVPTSLPDGTVPPNAGATLRCITGSSTDSCTSTTPTPVNTVGLNAGGWYVNLYTTDTTGQTSDAGERVVVNPAAIFSTNTVVFESLITGAQSTDACNPSTQGAILALNALTGGAGGVSALGAGPIAGVRIVNARTSGSLPAVSAVGGAKAYLPGATQAPAPSGSSAAPPVSVDIPNWRRRSWRVLMNDQ